MKRKLKLFWCWIKHINRHVAYYWRLLRWWWRGTDNYCEPWDFRSLSYNCDRLKIIIEAWVAKKQKEKTDG